MMFDVRLRFIPLSLDHVNYTIVNNLQCIPVEEMPQCSNFFFLQLASTECNHMHECVLNKFKELDLQQRCSIVRKDVSKEWERTRDVDKS